MWLTQGCSTYLAILPRGVADFHVIHGSLFHHTAG